MTRHHDRPRPTPSPPTPPASTTVSPDAGRRARRRRHLRPAHRAGRQAARRRPGAHARVQRLDPRPDAPRPPGIRDHRPRPQRRRHRGHRPLARAAPRQPVRRRAVRDAGADPDRRRVHLPLQFPDAGLYWYHPHIREDYGLDMGLYGNIVVDPADADYWPPVEPRGRRHPRRRPRRGRPDRAVPRAPARPTSPWAASATSCSPAARPTSISTPGPARSSASTSPTPPTPALFNVALPGARMKLVGGDSGRYEHETFVDEVLLAPSERAIVDVCSTARDGPARAPHPGSHLHARHRRRSTRRVEPWRVLRPPVRAHCGPIAGAHRRAVERIDDATRERPPDKTLAFESLMPLLYGGTEARPRRAWTCPMHPDVVAHRARHVPELRDEARSPMSDDCRAMPAAATTHRRMSISTTPATASSGRT